MTGPLPSPAAPRPPYIPIQERRGGIYLPQADLWLDPHHPVPLAVVSHAHADHVAPHQQVIATPQTCHLLRARYSHKSAHTPLPFHQTMEAAGHAIRLLPAGHTLGSAMVHITRLEDGATLLYTGDFKTQPGLASEAAAPATADLLIMECTFGKPQYVFPPYEETRQRILHWCQDSLAVGLVPVLLGYSLGKAQELLAIFRGSDLPVAVHSTVEEMCLAYETLGCPLPPREVMKSSGSLAGRVLIVPPQILRSQQLRRLGAKVSAMASGWAMSPSARFQQGVDELFPLSDHAGYPDLLAFVEAARPGRVLTTHGFAEDFARDLRQRGWDAWTLAGRDQRDLLLEFHDDAPPAAPPENAALPDSGWGRFCAVADAVAAKPGRLEKTAALREYLAALEEADLPLAARFLTGLPAATRAQRQQMQTGWAAIRLALREFSGLTEAAYKAISATQGDAARVAQLALERGRAAPEPWSLANIQALFDSLRAAPGGLARSHLLRGAFARLTPSEGRHLVATLTGDTRSGLKEGLLEEALAAAFATPPEQVREAHMLTGDIGETALLAKRGALQGLEMRLFQPIRAMLASPGQSAEAIWTALGAAEGGVWLEPKFDGIRAQIHLAPGQAQLFSRDLRSMTAEFPDLSGPASRLGISAALDGEIIAFAEGRQLSFFDLQRRLGRKKAATGPDLFAEEIPLRCAVFDLLWLDGQPLLHLPLAQRRAMLEQLTLPAPFELVPLTRASCQADIEAAFAQARAAGREGLMAKDPASAYSAGRRGQAWLKLKRADFSLDCLVVRAQQGHGKRSHVLSDYTFALRDERDGGLKIVGKAYTGLADAEIEELTAHFTRQTIAQRGKIRDVVPDTVLEIGFDSIQASPRHDSGLSLRFPRIRAIRRDKTVGEIDTLATARRLAGLPPLSS